MIPVKVSITIAHSTYGSAWQEYIVHVVNRSKHALKGAIRSAWRKHPSAVSITAEFTEAA